MSVYHKTSKIGSFCKTCHKCVLRKDSGPSCREGGGGWLTASSCSFFRIHVSVWAHGLLLSTALGCWLGKGAAQEPGHFCPVRGSSNPLCKLCSELPHRLERLLSNLHHHQGWCLLLPRRASSSDLSQVSLPSNLVPTYFCFSICFPEMWNLISILLLFTDKHRLSSSFVQGTELGDHSFN